MNLAGVDVVKMLALEFLQFDEIEEAMAAYPWNGLRYLKSSFLVLELLLEFGVRDLGGGLPHRQGDQHPSGRNLR